MRICTLTPVKNARNPLAVMARIFHTRIATGMKPVFTASNVSAHWWTSHLPQRMNISSVLNVTLMNILPSAMNARKQSCQEHARWNIREIAGMRLALAVPDASSQLEQRASSPKRTRTSVCHVMRSNLQCTVSSVRKPLLQEASPIGISPGIRNVLFVLAARNHCLAKDLLPGMSLPIA